jgi:thiol-disulfide isomerase/thioredoxin
MIRHLRGLAFVLACFAIAPAALAADEPQPGAGEVAPQPLGVTRGGDAVEAAQFKGKVLVVTFWASWCAPCLRELPMLEGLQRTVPDRLQVVAVNIEERDQFRRVYAKLPALTLKVSHDANKGAANAYGVKGIPHMLIVGRDGVIVRKHVGYGEDSLDHIVQDVNLALQAR